MEILRFLRARFGRYVDKELGYSLRVTYKNFPGMNIEYVEGPRTMNVFGEIMANLKDLDVDLSTFGRWEPPHQSEPIDNARASTVLARLVSALAYMGLAVRFIGHIKGSS
jgi:hypothetical protein